MRGMITWEGCGDDVEGYAEAVAKRLEVGGVCFVMNILHSHMEGLDGEVGNVHLGTASQKL